MPAIVPAPTPAEHGWRAGQKIAYPKSCFSRILLQRVAQARQPGFVMLKRAVDDGNQPDRCR
jgi:hypothetical protein